MADKLHKQCLAYQKTQLQPPPEALVLKWGTALGLSPAECQTVSSQLELRHIRGKFTPPQKNSMPIILFF